MTTLIADSVDLTPPAARPDSAARWRAMLALARVESVRMMRHPVNVAAVLFFLGPWLYSWLSGEANRYPFLPAEAVGLQLPGMLLLGGGALVVANLAALRAHRHHTDVVYDTLVLPAWWRTGAFVLALLPYTGLVTVLVAVRIGVLAALPDAAGALEYADLATIPMVVALFGVAGVLFAHLVKSTVVAPLAVLMFSVLLFVSVASASRDTWWGLLLPVIFDEVSFPLPDELVSRPAGWHLGYLVGLAAALAVAALIRAGARGRWTVTAAVTCVVLVVGFAVVQSRRDESVPVARITATENPAATQTCRPVGPVTYCPFEDFQPWVAGWDEVTRGVLRRVPTPSGPPLAVRQRVWAHGYPVEETVTGDDLDRDEVAWQRASAAGGAPEAVSVGTTWGDGRSEAAFAAAVGYRLIAGHASGARSSICGARGAVVVWLAGQGGPHLAAGVRDLDASSSGSLVFWSESDSVMVSVPDREAAVGVALLDRPADEVSAVVTQHWAELTAVDTGADRLAALFDIAITSELPERERSVCVG